MVGCTRSLRERTLGDVSPAHRQCRPFSHSDTMKPAAQQMTYSPGGQSSRSSRVARPMCCSIADATVASVDCRCEIASQGERDCRATTSAVDGMHRGVRHAGGDRHAADRAQGHRAWPPIPPFAAVVVETEPSDEWLTTNSLWWLMLAPADQLTRQAPVER
jgi:hypothetical protein